MERGVSKRPARGRRRRANAVEGGRRPRPPPRAPRAALPPRGQRSRRPNQRLHPYPAHPRPGPRLGSHPRRVEGAGSRGRGGRGGRVRRLNACGRRERGVERPLAAHGGRGGGAARTRVPPHAQTPARPADKQRHLWSHGWLVPGPVGKAPIARGGGGRGEPNTQCFRSPTPRSAGPRTMACAPRPPPSNPGLTMVDR